MFRFIPRARADGVLAVLAPAALSAARVQEELRRDAHTSLGLLFAGGGGVTFANPISDVLDDLAGTLGVASLTVVGD